MASCHTHAPLHAPLHTPPTHPSHLPHTPPTHLPRTFHAPFFPTPSAYFTIRIGRCRHPHRSTQTSVSVDADIRNDRRRHPHRSAQTSVSVGADIRIGRRRCPNLPYSNIFFVLIICKFQIILLYLQPSRRHKQPNTNIFFKLFSYENQTFTTDCSPATCNLDVSVHLW